jgi:hypothetical protein
VRVEVNIMDLISLNDSISVKFVDVMLPVKATINIIDVVSQETSIRDDIFNITIVVLSKAIVVNYNNRAERNEPYDKHGIRAWRGERAKNGMVVG